MPNLTWKIEKRKVADLVALEKNPRKISKTSMEKLKDRITKRGMHDVLKLDTKGVVLSGNMRTEALKQLKIETVDVMIPNRDLTEEERGAIVLESNKNDGEWDMSMLPEFGQDVLLEAGFETVEVDQLMHDDEDEEDGFDIQKDIDNIKKPTAKMGDMYQCGNHVIMHGDSTKKEDVEKLMGGGKSGHGLPRSPFQHELCQSRQRRHHERQYGRGRIYNFLRKIYDED